MHTERRSTRWHSGIRGSITILRKAGDHTHAWQAHHRLRGNDNILMMATSNVTWQNVHRRTPLRALHTTYYAIIQYVVQLIIVAFQSARGWPYDGPAVVGMHDSAAVPRGAMLRWPLMDCIVFLSSPRLRTVSRAARHWSKPEKEGICRQLQKLMTVALYNTHS